MANGREKNETSAAQAKRNQFADDEAKVKESPALQEAPGYRIACRNAVSKEIGGVAFTNGVGYTNDGFTASWFSNKDGYEVSGV